MTSEIKDEPKIDRVGIDGMDKGLVVFCEKKEESLTKDQMFHKDRKEKK